MSVTGIVADIQRASVHDGPGIRTTVFLKGCPLNCAWCHNPECISFEPQEMYYPEKCIGCGECKKGCVCGARVICGRKMTADEILAEVLLDKPYYRDVGGMTISGGEPLAQPELTLELLKKCRENGIHTAIETSLCVYNSEIFQNCDLIMADFKLWNDMLHKKYTGISNAKIVKNFRRLDDAGARYIVRTPVIPGVTDLDDVTAFVKTLKNAEKHQLLPYNPLGISKAKALGVKQTRFDI